MMVYFIIKFKFHYLPESIVVVLIGTFVCVFVYAVNCGTLMFQEQSLV